VRIRILVAAAAVAIAMTMSACASTVAGSPQAGAGTAEVTDLSSGSTDTAMPTDTALPPDTALPTGELPTDTAGPTDELPTDTTQTTDTAQPTDELPTDELPSDTAGSADEPPTDELPSDATEFPTGTELPTSIPGLSPECNQVYGIVVFFSNVLTQDTPITEKQVDTAFGDVSAYPSDIQADITALHQVATKMVGKSGTEALMEIGSSDASKAMDGLSTYMGNVCKYGG